MKTIAEIISAKFNDNGMCFEAEDGRLLLEVLEEECVRRSERSADVRYELSDESAIVVSGGGWDLGHPGAHLRCWCWPTACGLSGHHPECEERPWLCHALQASD